MVELYEKNWSRKYMTYKNFAISISILFALTIILDLKFGTRLSLLVAGMAIGANFTLVETNNKAQSKNNQSGQRG